MGILDILRGKKTCTCDCNQKEESLKEEKKIKDGVRQVKILGIGCKNCITLAENTKKAFDKMGEEVEIIKVTDMKDIASYGIISTPGLVLDEKVISYGKVLKPEDIIKLVEKK